MARNDTFRLIYTSRSLIPAERVEAALGEILSTARSNNGRRGINSVLLLSGDRFVQSLEGDEQQVQRLYDEISEDERHTEVTIVDERRTDGPTFGWAMARMRDPRQLEQRRAEGRRERQRIEERYGRPTSNLASSSRSPAERGDYVEDSELTSDQEVVADFMRGVARQE